ncbi:hypothetical protein HF325_006676 [Metschnikowia pulcherrima]|uniref:Uncharacterized protein n=1 Tax=Metschnikowia pulcherrima TaxID=27326 RepID=A0A8H7L8L9_9ASCO|nr:hypothetical protein HF325_006676 [Metschnikowia pulcherrima]
MVGSILITLSAIASPMQTIVYGKIFDKLAQFLSGDYSSVELFLHDLRVLIGAMMGIAGGRLIFAWLGITVWLIVGENTQMNARKSLFESLLHKDVEWLGTKENLIGSITLFFRCIEEIRSGISENLGLFVQTIASVCCLFVIAMISLWSLTLIICCSIPLSAASSWVFGSLTAKYATRENMQNARASKILDWSFGQYLVKTGQLGLGNVITAFSACVLFGTEISSVGDIVALLNKAQASSNTIDALDFEDHYSMTLENLSFRYRNTDSDVVNHVSTTFTLSQINFVVGESGSGKSTVALLLSGFLEKSKGEMFVDNVNFEFLAPEWFTENVCFVELRPLIFERLLAANLLLGSNFSNGDRATETLLEEACAFADLTGFVSQLPNKLHTVLDSNKLSGGQIQKIGLARAWLANRPVLILDEALGSINQKLKLLIMEKIRVWRKNCLTLIISHDLTDIRGLDHVVVMEKGRVKSSGYADDMRSILPKLSLVSVKAEDDLVDSHTETTETYNYMNNPAILRDLELMPAAGLQVEKTESLGLIQIVKFCYKTTENKFLIALGLICSLLGGVATPGLSYCFAEVLLLIVKYSFSPSNGHGSVVTWCLIIVAVSVAELAVTFGSHMSLQYALEQWILKLRKLCLAKINDQDMSFFASSKPSYLNTLLMNDTRDLRNLVSEFLLGLLLVVSLTLLGLIWATVIGWKLALVGMAFVPLVFLVTLTYSFLLQKYETAYKDHVADAEKFSLEVVTAMRTVRLFGLATQLSSEYTDKLRRLYRAGCKRAVSGGFGIALLEFCGTSATATVLYYGMYLIVRQEYSQKQMIQVLTMLTITVASASHLMKLLPEIARGQRAGTLISRILTLHELPVECDGTENRALPNVNKPVLAFKNVAFAYSDPQSMSFKAVLRELSFEIYSGEAVVFAGECGLGKSTITQLILRLHQQDRGEISYHGKDVRVYDPEWYRCNVALVGQEPHFFEGSVIDNLLYGLSGSARIRGEAHVEECLLAVNALEFVEKLPDYLDTIMGKECLFSLGQLQRLSIARVLLRKPKVIIFDEPTSRLDSENLAKISKLIFHDLHEIDPRLTTVVISHDPRVMAQASRILMVQKGAIAEDGPFDELIEKNGAFAQFMA